MISEKPESNNVYTRIGLFPLIGFIVFFCESWIGLSQITGAQAAQSPYAGPPRLMTCLLLGCIGLVFGAFRRRGSLCHPGIKR